MKTPNTQQTPEISGVLSRLRRQIRWYIWQEGWSVVVTAAAIGYWTGLAFDYGPVWFGGEEMPRSARIVWLALLVLSCLYVGYRWIVRRLWVSLSDRNMALLLERKFPALNDALLTAVATTPPDPLDARAAPPTNQDTGRRLFDELLSRTQAQAIERLGALDVRNVLRWRPLVMRATVAIGLLLTIAGFACWQPWAFRLWTERLLLASDAPWPRRAALEVLDFVDGQRKIAAGSDLVVRVRAEAKQRVAPEICRIDYRLASGQRGRVNMVREGDSQDGFQYYRFDRAPFQSMLESLDFDVSGLDARVTDLHVEVVPSPAIVDVDLDCEFPAYTQLPPRHQKWQPGVRLPAGSRVTLALSSSKPLREAHLQDLESGAITDWAPTNSQDAQKILYPVAALNVPTTWQITLVDQDGVPSQQPFRLSLQIIEDGPPKIDVQLQGIGTAITPDARLAVEGHLEDDYGVQETWFQIQDAAGKLVKLPVPVPRATEFAAAIDLRQERERQAEPALVQPGDKIVMSLRATDFCDLPGATREGHGDEWPLEVVTADELLAMLEARELGIKRRFEQILSELVEMRDALARIQAEVAGPSPATTPPATPDGQATPDPAADEEPPVALLVLRIQRAQQQAGKSQQETAGVASAFHDIREELINNRIDTPERRDRLQNDIVDPLNRIVGDQFPLTFDAIVTLERELADHAKSQQNAVRAVEQTNELIFALQAVLEKMLELETYNELVDLVRTILSEQNGLLEKTQSERKRQARALLEE